MNAERAGQVGTPVDEWARMNAALERLHRIERAAKWLVDIHADDVTLVRGSALWEDLQSLKSALAALPQPGEPT